MQTILRMKKGLCIGFVVAVVSILMPLELYAATHYVDINSATPVAPYTNWSSAATGIQQAVDASISGDTVLITNGTYLLSAQISVTKDITIESVNGPDFTIVDGGGAVRCFSLGNTRSILSGLTIRNGYTTGYGGGINCSDRPIVSNCIITGNSASSGGGMCYGKANNCTINGNSARLGGGKYGGTAINCTISRNRAEEGGGGVLSGWARNCIIWDNEATYAKNVDATTSYCFSPDVTHGMDGNSTNAPMLLSASHVATNSPCRGAGNPAFSSGTDIDGQAWLNPPSIGCDESYGPGTYTGPIELELSGTGGLFSAGHSVAFTAIIQGAITETRIAFGDGLIATNSPYFFEHVWATGGDYELVLTAFNDSYPGGVSVTQIVHVVSEDVSTIHISAATGNDAADGLSWATAKQTIQAGVDAQNVTGGMVITSNGTYVVGSEINVAKALRIESVNGPNSTIVDGGGAVRCFSLGNTHSVLKGLTITNGFATDGGGIYCSGSAPIITNCLIIGNSAESYGGGIYKGTANDCTISRNSAAYGGGIFDATANNCTISGNLAEQGGGIFSTYIFSATANNCAISGNSAEEGGGGMFSGTANNCMITGNSARLGGGAYYTGILNNCAISGNSASYGGGIAGCTANNCTISGNTATYTSGGVAAAYGSSAVWGYVNNCIIWYNKSGDGINLNEDVIATHCFSPDVRHGVDGNSTNAPMLLSASRIATNSPCRGAGNPDFISGTDIDGQTWLNPPSIGCDESHGPGTFLGEIELALTGPTNLFLTGYPVPFTAFIQGALTKTQIAFDNGETATNLPYIFEYTWATGGDYNAVFTAFNDSYPGGISATQTIHVVSEEASTIYVSGTTGNDDADGLSWATAKQTIQAGVDAQNVTGGKVILSNGTYAVASEIKVDKKIRVIGLNGPDHTIVDGGGSNRCFNLENSPCLLRGLTITNGFATVDDEFMTADGGGIYCNGFLPVITNCVINGNSATGNGGGMYYGTANNCAFSGNSAESGGGTSHVLANHCVISGNSAKFGGGMYDGKANHCVISGNSAAHGGGIIHSTANNCTISGNTAIYGGGGVRLGKVYNCIIWFNEASRDEDVDFYSPIYCSTPDAAHGVNGNITNAPLFVDADGGDYHLQSNSPCINWGDNSYVNSTVDLDGNPRVVGAYVDMGAYEYQTDVGADGDHDGMPDDWERDFFGFNILPQENADNDAHSNVDEFIAGTDPTNGASYFTAASSVAQVNGTNAFVVEWIAIPDRLYSIQWTTNLTEGFLPLQAGIEYPQNRYIPSQPETNQHSFYKLDVIMDPASK